MFSLICFQVRMRITAEPTAYRLLQQQLVTLRDLGVLGSGPQPLVQVRELAAVGDVEERQVLLIVVQARRDGALRLDPRYRPLQI